MRLAWRLSLFLIVGVAAVSLGLTLYQTSAQTRAMRRDLERQSLLLAESLARTVEPLVEAGSNDALALLVERFKDRESVAGVAAYDVQGAPLATTSGLTAMFASEPAVAVQAASKGWTRAEFVSSAAGAMHVVALPLRDDGQIRGALAIVNNATYIDSRAAALWRRALIGVGVQTMLILGITLALVNAGVRRPMLDMAQWLRDLRMGAVEGGARPASEFEPLAREVNHLASSLTEARAAAQQEARLRDTAESTWTNERLRVFVENRLGGARLFAVSNREPYEDVHRAGGIQSVMPASGLVTALEPVLRACNGTWVATGTGDADRETVDEFDRVRVPPEEPAYTLRRVWLSQEEQRGFYYGFANEGIWPLCHIAHTRPIFRSEDWRAYREVNQRFANALLEEIEHESNPVVLVQDYHFALLPAMIKERRPDARVAIFWHIPWPNAEAFAICPWQRELLEGLLGADLIGFHIQAHCNNFLDTVDRALESRIERERFAVNRGGHLTLVRPYPISVPLDRAPSLEPTKAPAPKSTFMGVGVDRIDYTKGLPERMRGIEAFLDASPEYRGRFTFVQVASPSRTGIERYHDLIEEVEREAERINRRFETGDWRPIQLLARQHAHAEILPLYRAADLCLVTSLHDGMNLVAKEFVAARDDENGVLILSRFAGASHELVDAVVVNPYDTGELARAIRQALEMPPNERADRMRRMRQVVRERNIYRWAATLIGELCAVRTETEAPLVRTASGAF